VGVGVEVEVGTGTWTRSGVMMVGLWLLAVGGTITDVALSYLASRWKTWPLCGGANISDVRGMEDKERSPVGASCNRCKIGMV